MGPSVTGEVVHDSEGEKERETAEEGLMFEGPDS